MGIRRRFSSLSGNGANRQKSSKSSATASANSTPSLLPDNTQIVDGDENGNMEGKDNGIDLVTNLEAYKQRCRALEAENRRLMANQGQIVQESNRRLDAHVKEICQLKEQMEIQKRDNLELMRWTKSLECDCAKAKELAREWQRVGQFNNRMVQRELQSFQSRVGQLEAKCAKLSAENVELKRLCLYLDKQRQTLWQQLATKGSQEVFGDQKLNHVELAADENQRREENGSEDAGCGSSAPSSPSASSSTNSLKSGEATLSNQIELDGDQEKTLQSICSEMQSSMLLGELEAKVEEELACWSSNRMDEKKCEQQQNLHQEKPRIISPQILDEERFEQMPKLKVLPLCQTEHAAAAHMNNSALSENGSCNTSSSSSFGTTAQFGSSFTSSSDDTAILVLDTDDSQSMLHQANDSAILNGLAGLEVRELCTISEEEGDDSEDGLKLAKRQMGRLKLDDKQQEIDASFIIGYVNGKSEDAKDEVIRKRTTSHQSANVNASSLCSSLLAQAGSMLTSIVDEHQQQMTRSAAVYALVNAEDKECGNRNSSASTGSSSSGAFSGSSGTCSNDGLRKELSESVEDDDLPPEMPLISENLRLPTFGRPSSCMGTVNPLASVNPRSAQQSSTLPRASTNIQMDMSRSNGHGQNRPCSVVGQTIRPIHPPEYSSLNKRVSPRPQKKMMLVLNGEQQILCRQLKAPPVRIRVRPPPVNQSTSVPKLNGIQSVNSLDRPQPLPPNYSTPKSKISDITAL